MKKAIVRMLATIGALVVLGYIGFVTYMLTYKGSVPSKTILEVNFDREIIEYAPDDPVATVTMRSKPRLRAVLDAIERAAGDQRVVGLVAKIGGSGGGMAQIQELRDAITAFREKGKWAVAYSETFGEAAPGNGGYYLATAFDRIYMQPSGDVGLTGLMSETPFVRGALDKLGVVPRLDHRHEYKNAMNTFTDKKFTEPHREALTKVLDSLFGQMVSGIATGRKLPEAQVRTLVDKGPYLGQEAVTAKLVDQLAYRDQVYAEIKQKAGKDAQFLFLGKYLERAGGPYEEGRSVALIFGVGSVARNNSDYNPVTGGLTMGSDTVAGAFRDAIEDQDVKAILFRVDSPGGSYVASDAIWHEVIRAKQAGKPVIVSMGNVAGSGGYFVAMGADKIVAQPATITGSIGVLGGKAVTTAFWEKLGVTFDAVQTSQHAGMYSTGKDYSPEEWVRFQAWLDRVYADFTGKAAQGRKLSKEQVLQIAKGRIWSGADAKALGLVDELGGYSTALKLTRQAANIPLEAPLHLKEFPVRKTPLARLLDRGPESSEPATQTLVSVLEALRPALALADRLGLISNPGVLTMPDMGEVR